MALVNLSDRWGLEDYAQVYQASSVNQPTESDPLSALSHYLSPGLTWRIQLYPRGDEDAEPNYASAYVIATFGSGKESVTNVWVQWTMSVVACDANANLQKSLCCTEYLMGGLCSWGFSDAFLQKALEASADKTKGRLEMKLDLGIFKIVELLKCRETVRTLFSDKKQADVTIVVAGEPFKIHRAVIANRCAELRGTESIPIGTTAEVFRAFLGAIYFDNFEFQASWQMALGVYHLADNFGAVSLKKFSDDAAADLIPSLGYAAVLQVLPAALRCKASLTAAACIRCLRETDGLVTSPEFKEFMASTGTDIKDSVLIGLFRARCPECEPVSAVFRAGETKLAYTWEISSADLLKAIQPRPTFRRSPLILEHKAFPLLKWQLVFYPGGNTKDPSHMRGYASLYLKALFGPNDDDLKAVYACWTATIMAKGVDVCVPASPDFVLYTGAEEMKYGFANAFQFDPVHAAISTEANNSAVVIRLELTIASIPEILKCRGLISTLRSDTAHADVEIDVKGTIFKAHKFILAARSTEFARVFGSGTKNIGKVEVLDTTPAAFESFIAGVYYESWEFISDVDATIDVLGLAERFGVADLKRYCDEALAHFVERANVLKILKVALARNATATKAACVKILFASEERKTATEWIAFRTQNKPIAYDIAEAIGESCKDKGQVVRDSPSAAVAKVSGSWIIEDYAHLLASIKVGKSKELGHLSDLSHFAFPGLTWAVSFHPYGLTSGAPSDALVYLYAYFGADKQRVNCVGAKWTLTVLAGDASAVLSERTGGNESLRHGQIVALVQFRQDAAKSVSRLEFKLDLTLINNAELLKCRETIRGSLAENHHHHADLTVNVAGKPFNVHKAIMTMRCDKFLETAPVGTTADAYTAFLGAVYWNDFEFLAKWELALGVLRLSDKFVATDLKEFCDRALAELIPTLAVSELLKILSVAFHHNAPVTKAKCTRILAEKKTDESTSEPECQAICEAFQEFGIVAVPTAKEVVYSAPEVKLWHSWAISGAELSTAIVSRPPAPVSLKHLKHKAFPGLTWKLELYPRGNSQDSNHKPGFASLYLTAIFGPESGGLTIVNLHLQEVYAKWTATVTFMNGKQVLVPASPEFRVYTRNGDGAKFGYANAFRWEQSDNAQPSKSCKPTDTCLFIRLDLTFASIPVILKCNRFISLLHSDQTHADVEIDINGVSFKAHKFILAARCSAFSGMFEAAMKESTSGRVEIEDTTPEAFKAFLAAVYCRRWRFLADKDLTKEVLVLAEKYGVADLKRYCDEALARFANESNVFDLLQHAAIHNASIATAACCNIVCGSEELLGSDIWADFKKDNRELGFDIVEAIGDHYGTLKQ